MEHLPLIVIEVVMIFGGALAFGWWQLRDLDREKRKRERQRESEREIKRQIEHEVERHEVRDNEREVGHGTVREPAQTPQPPAPRGAQARAGPLAPEGPSAAVPARDNRTEPRTPHAP